MNLLVRWFVCLWLILRSVKTGVDSEWTTFSPLVYLAVIGLQSGAQKQLVKPRVNKLHTGIQRAHRVSLYLRCTSHSAASPCKYEGYCLKLYKNAEVCSNSFLPIHLIHRNSQKNKKAFTYVALQRNIPVWSSVLLFLSSCCVCTSVCCVLVFIKAASVTHPWGVRGLWQPHLRDNRFIMSDREMNHTDPSQHQHLLSVYSAYYYCDFKIRSSTFVSSEDFSQHLQKTSHYSLLSFLMNQTSGCKQEFQVGLWGCANIWEQHIHLSFCLVYQHQIKDGMEFRANTSTEVDRSLHEFVFMQRHLETVTWFDHAGVIRDS